jgi:prostaglandin-E synthase 1
MGELFAEPVFRVYAICAAILVLKMWLTGGLTGLMRIRRAAYATPEDYAFMGKAVSEASDETVERLRRAHRNDLENILPFLAIGLLYALSRPSYTLALVLCVAFTAGRVLHTVAYIASLQPWRTLFYEVGNIALVVMVIHLIVRIL